MNIETSRSSVLVHETVKTIASGCSIEFLSMSFSQSAMAHMDDVNKPACVEISMLNQVNEQAL